MLNILKFLLFPFSIIYHAVTALRNYLYDKGLFKSYTFDVKLISVGNLSVGGTGKSPMIEYLIKKYKDDYKIGVLSRGYNRQSKGFLEVDLHMKAIDVGDEPLQFKNKFKSVPIFVDADRKHGLENIQKLYPEIEIIFLDDAFQHRRVKPDINILLTTFDKPFYKDFLLPVGRLRESKTSVERADYIVVTKCPPDISSTVKSNIKQKMNLKSNQTLVFSEIEYSQTLKSQNRSMEFETLDDFYLITGIANPKPLLDYLQSKHKSFEHLRFADHHNFSKAEIEDIQSYTKPIVTTEKDFIRLKGLIDKEIFYIAIQVKLDQDLKLI
ncbi:tetraacyldisaccharide 4'-kinase [Flavobacterium sp. CS20]|jgi:tetraacyldisaccharide 4'-kinase|uniref:tetraacyldisaccharide 4'-kinase n=1 Tax=Flavobacterium sp. CS20 TaxID=2775246 RepID=UPI001B39DFDC|nr:tetraacyldisaccharide 4'-kinase [Flavobacterium sp. CS20]QTY27034.1 tetraacyldisaccharide 4'-kinase [Flavobacterium sp. CS20]